MAAQAARLPPQLACPARLPAGHAGAILGDTWFIVGGGNNTSGCADMYAHDLAPLGAGPVQVGWVCCRCRCAVPGLVVL